MYKERKSAKSAFTALKAQIIHKIINEYTHHEQALQP